MKERKLNAIDIVHLIMVMGGLGSSWMGFGIELHTCPFSGNLNAS